MSNADVLVVGAGPTGLTAALELAAAGVSCRIVDKLAERSDKSRALVAQARTLELLERHGLGHFVGHLAKKRRFEVAFEDIGVGDTSFPFLTFVSQAETERVLEAARGAAGRDRCARGRAVRPDGYVGFRAPALSGAALLEHLRDTLEAS